LAWAWDLSGADVYLYPGKDVPHEQVTFKLQPGETREWAWGDGAPLFPARQIAGGLAVRVQIWESDQGARAFGKTLSDVVEAVKESKLTNIFKLIALAGGPTTATLAEELALAISAVLKANSDDFVDFYEGYFGATQPWEIGEETIRERNSEIVVSRSRS
jgi:hypothetical protein